MPSFHQPAPSRQSPHPATSKTVQHTTAAKAFGTLHLGALTEHIPVEMVREALTETGTHEQRTRRLSSARTVYFVLALALFPALGYLNVFAKLTAHAPLPAKISAAALTGARRRIGVKPLQLLFDLLRGPAPTVQREGSFHGRYRLCALDGTILTVADTVQNRLTYCKQPGLHAGTGYPQARLLALVACGTRSILDAVFGPTSIGETTYTPRLLRSMGKDMLVMADRNFASAALLHQIRQTGAQFLVRVKLGRNLPVHRVLPDGSYWIAPGLVEVCKHHSRRMKACPRNTPTTSRNAQLSSSCWPKATRIPPTGPLPESLRSSMSKPIRCGPGYAFTKAPVRALRPSLWTS